MPQDRRNATDPLNTSGSRSWPGVMTSDALRRRMYLWAIALGTGVLVVVWFMQLGRSRPDYYVLYGHPVLLLQCLWAAVWLLRGRALIVAERAVFVLNALAILVQMLLATVEDPQQMVGPTSAAYWMVVAISVLGYLIFGNRQALLLSAGFYAVGVALPWLAVLVRGGRSRPAPSCSGCS